jgi:hypothetical protein
MRFLLVTLFVPACSTGFDEPEPSVESVFVSPSPSPSPSPDPEPSPSPTAAPLACVYDYDTQCFFHPQNMVIKCLPFAVGEGWPSVEEPCQHLVVNGCGHPHDTKQCNWGAQTAADCVPIDATLNCHAPAW